MKCPNCSGELTSAVYKEIEVNRCASCEGKWFDYSEIDQLEDQVFDNDEIKNTLVANIRPSNRNCPVCEKNMQLFNYRWSDLELEICSEKHGFWLDKGEEERVYEQMKEYTSDLEHKAQAEMEWKQHLDNLRSASFFQKIKDLFS